MTLYEFFDLLLIFRITNIITEVLLFLLHYICLSVLLNYRVVYVSKRNFCLCVEH